MAAPAAPQGYFNDAQVAHAPHLPANREHALTLTLTPRARHARLRLRPPLRPPNPNPSPSRCAAFEHGLSALAALFAPMHEALEGFYAHNDWLVWVFACPPFAVFNLNHIRVMVEGKPAVRGAAWIIGVSAALYFVAAHHLLGWTSLSGLFGSPEDAAPADTFFLRRLLAALPWYTRVPRRPQARSPLPSPSPPSPPTLPAP